MNLLIVIIGAPIGSRSASCGALVRDGEEKREEQVGHDRSRFGDTRSTSESGRLWKRRVQPGEQGFHPWRLYN